MGAVKIKSIIVDRDEVPDPRMIYNKVNNGCQLKEKVSWR
jgi:hypothetical protein